MTFASLILQGALIGLSLAAPVGPMAMLCIQRTLSGGLALGILSGLGIAVADAVYGLIAAFGLTVVTEFLVAYRVILGIAGGAFLIWLGVQSMGAPVSNEPKSLAASSRWSAFASAFFLTLTNPMTILAYIAIFSSAAINIQQSYCAPLVMTGAILFGSLAWWIALCSLVAVSKHRLKSTHIQWINRISGLILVSFGIYFVLSQK